MKRDLTVIGRNQVEGTARNVVRITATNYAGDELSMDFMVNGEEQYDVYDIITVTVEPRKS